MKEKFYKSLGERLISEDYNPEGLIHDLKEVNAGDDFIQSLNQYTNNECGDELFNYLSENMKRLFRESDLSEELYKKDLNKSQVMGFGAFGTFSIAVALTIPPFTPLSIIPYFTTALLTAGMMKRLYSPLRKYEERIEEKARGLCDELMKRGDGSE